MFKENEPMNDTSVGGCGMIVFELKESPDKNYGCGAFGIVVFFKDKGEAIKIFAPRNDRSEDRLFKIFKSEVEAYEKIWLAEEAPELKKITPKFYGEVQDSEVFKVQKKNENPSTKIPMEFISKPAYKMEYVMHTFKKFGVGDCDTKDKEVIKKILSANKISLSNEDPIIDIRCLFNNYGLWAGDVSIAFDEKKERMWVVDFATENFGDIS